MRRTGLTALAILAASLSAGVSASAEQTGYLRTWGWPSYGLCDPPPGDDFVAVDGGADHAIALRADGSIVSWGRDYRRNISDTPAGNDFTGIAACGSAGLALRSNGSICVWGSSSPSFNSPPSGNDFIAIDGGAGFGLALRGDGTIAAWGYDWHGSVFNAPKGPGFTAISAGADGGLALRADGTIAAWGSNEYGQVNSRPTEGGFVAISAGGFHNLALRADGSIVAWGWDEYGQVSGVPAGNDFVAIAAGGTHSLALRSEGTLAAWGNDRYGEVRYTPTEAGFVAIACGSQHSMAIGPWGPPGPAVRLECSVTDLGDGLHGLTFTVRGNGTTGQSFFAEVTFEGTGDGQIQQTQPFPGVDVNLESQADAFEGFGEPPYDKQHDTYLLEPFSDADIAILEQGENSYRIAAGTGGGRAFEDAPLAYVCTSGDLRYQGTLYRDGMHFPVSGFVRLPEPAGMALLGLGALALIRRR